MPLKRYRWLRGHARPVDLLLPLLALVLAIPLWWPWLFGTPPPLPLCPPAAVATRGGGGER